MCDAQHNHEMLNGLENHAFLIDREGYLVAANPAWLQYLHMQRDFVIGRHLKSVLWDYHFSRHLEKNGAAASQDEGDAYLAALQVLETGACVSRVLEGGESCVTAYPVLDGGGGALAYVLSLAGVLPEDTAPPPEAVGRRAADPTDRGLIGESPQMERLHGLIREVAPTDTTLLIVGETGVGKEVVANEIQRLSSRGAAPFISINCAAIPENLMESELFGHESGAFTGAVRGGKAGYLEQANHGTVLLDEIGELSLAMQPKLLRALQEQVIYRVGGSKPIPIDVRILAATNRDLFEMAARKQFREDLYYRLSVIPIYVPPLRERGDDVMLLAESFLQTFNEKYAKHKVFTPQALGILCAHHWPGNVRELRNLVERLVVLGSHCKITPEDVQTLFAPMPPAGNAADRQLSLKEGTEQYQAALIKTALARYGSTYKAAAALGTSQTTLVRKARQFGIREQ